MNRPSLYPARPADLPQCACGAPDARFRSLTDLAPTCRPCALAQADASVRR